MPVDFSYNLFESKTIKVTSFIIKYEKNEKDYSLYTTTPSSAGPRS